MTKPEAMALQAKIEALCNQEGVWSRVGHDRRPELRMINIEITIKVDGEP